MIRFCDDNLKNILITDNYKKIPGDDFALEVNQGGESFRESLSDRLARLEVPNTYVVSKKALPIRQATFYIKRAIDCNRDVYVVDKDYYGRSCVPIFFHYVGFLSNDVDFDMAITSFMDITKIYPKDFVYDYMLKNFKEYRCMYGS